MFGYHKQTLKEGRSVPRFRLLCRFIYDTFEKTSEEGLAMIRVEQAFFNERFPKRKRDAHKGDFGKVLIFAGSCGMAGAAALSGRAALRSGAGLVQFLIPSFSDPIYPILQILVPEATCITPDKIGFYGMEDSSAADGLNAYSAIAAGSGLGADSVRLSLLSFLLRHFSGPMVLDADALNAVARGDITKEDILSSSAKFIFTPHVGEAKRLLSAVSTGKSGAIRTEKERLSAAETLSAAYRSTVLLKGAGTLIVSPSGEVYQNTTGNPGMATGGSGDVLSGIIAAFAGQGLSATEAAACGAFLHGKAGDLAANALSESAVTAGDLITYLPDAWKR